MGHGVSNMWGVYPRRDMGCLICTARDMGCLICTAEGHGVSNMHRGGTWGV